MAEATVSSAIVGKSIEACNKSIEALNKTAGTLQRRYMDAGAGWKDRQYSQLGGIIQECQSALNQPVTQLNDCIKSLQDLLKAIVEYQQVSF